MLHPQPRGGGVRTLLKPSPPSINITPPMPRTPLSLLDLFPRQPPSCSPPLPSDSGQIGSCISIATSRRKPFMDIFFPSVFSIIWFYFIFLFFLSYLLDIRYSSRVYKMMEIIVHVICYIGWEIVAFFLLVSIFESRFCLYILSHLYKDPRWYRVFQLKLTSISVDSTISSKKKKKQTNVRPREFASKNLILRTPPAVKSKISELLL